MERILNFVFLMALLFLAGCSTEGESEIAAASKKLFSRIPSSQSKVFFNNTLKMTESYNPYIFKNFLNGGGVALGDINNDGLVDIYLTGNQVTNKLYLNKGQFEFEDITLQSETECKDVWCTGAAFVDINHDGYLDIYVCKSGKPNTPIRYNQLFVNNGDLSFTDRAKEYGLDFVGLSIHSAFFDYDNDGDLDCYLLNNSIRSVGGYDIAEGLRNRPNPESGNKLLKNMEVETGQINFVDVSEAAGVYTSEIGFGLGVSISDLNGDNWPDIYVSNDFFEKDYLYLNQKDGTFKEVIDKAMYEISTGSMGADIADMNNDSKPEVFVTEMLPEDLARYKSKTVFESYDKNRLNKDKGYHNQFGRNVFQQNIGNRDGIPQFRELGRYHQVEASDWSWGALLFDMNNDGFKDIFIANGIMLDLLDQDHINFYDNQKIGQMVRANKEDVIMTIMADFPRQPLSNHYYLQDNEGEYQKVKSTSYCLPGYSNGSAYADLDNDGDLDLVINNIEGKASLLRNNSESYSLSIRLEGSQLNTRAIGAKVKLFSGQQLQLQEHNPMRGYQSCVSNKLVFGIGNETLVDSLIVIWPDGKESRRYNLSADSCYVLSYSKASLAQAPRPKVVRTLLEKVSGVLDYEHQENAYPDFDRNRLLTHKLSNSGPQATAIKEKAGNTLLLISGSKKQATSLYTLRGKALEASTVPEFQELRELETVEVLADDLDGNGVIDYLMLNGGGENQRRVNETTDFVLLNGGKKSELQKINHHLQSSCGIAIDLNADGFKEIIVGARMKPFAYGLPADAAVYSLTDNTYQYDAELSQPLKALGLVRDVIQADLDGDGKNEIIFSREYSNLSVFKIVLGQLVEEEYSGALGGKKGLWDELLALDVDKDGDMDLVACNMGLNNRLYHIAGKTYYAVVGDLDDNERIDFVHCIKKDGKFFPIHLKEELMMQMPKLKKKSLKYSDYADISMSDLIGHNKMQSALIYEINELRSGIFMNENNRFQFVPLPKEVQYSEQRAIWAGDLNGDDYPDLVMGGNQYEAKPELGINAASFGHVLINDQQGGYMALPVNESGFFEKGQVRDLVDISFNGKRHILVLKNNDKAVTYKINGINE